MKKWDRQTQYTLAVPCRLIEMTVREVGASRIGLSDEAHVSERAESDNMKPILT
jgi:hypothetical protein